MTVETKNLVLGAVATAAAVASTTSAASAADVADIGDWSGFYVGGGVAYLNGDLPFSYDDDNYEVSAGAVTGFAGFNYQTGSVVMGAELAYSTGGFAETTDSDEADYNYNLDSVTDAKVRLGFDMGPALLYVTGGLSSVNFTAVSANNYTAWGYNLGAGAEMMLTDDISLGAEALYRSVSNDYQDSDTDSGHGRDADLWSFTLRAAYHF